MTIILGPISFKKDKNISNKKAWYSCNINCYVHFHISRHFSWLWLIYFHIYYLRLICRSVWFLVITCLNAQTHYACTKRILCALLKGNSAKRLCFITQITLTWVHFYTHEQIWVPTYHLCVPPPPPPGKHTLHLLVLTQSFANFGPHLIDRKICFKYGFSTNITFEV